MQCNNKVHRL